MQRRRSRARGRREARHGACSTSVSREGAVMRKDIVSIAGMMFVGLVTVCHMGCGGDSAGPQQARQALGIDVELADTSHNSLLKGRYVFVASGFRPISPRFFPTPIQT